MLLLKLVAVVWYNCYGLLQTKYVFKLSNPQCLALGVVWMTVDAWMTR